MSDPSHEAIPAESRRAVTWIAGVDGCPAGWIAVLRPLEGDGFRVLLAPRLDGIVDAPEAPVSVAVDMPIGLPEAVGEGGRAPERLVRPLLGQRQSSVFSVPSRRAVFAGDYLEACRIAQETSTPPRKVAKQAFHIFPKIREVDLMLRSRPELAARIHECHPEVAFRTMLGTALPVAKKVRGRPNPEGLAFRRRLLAEQGFPQALLDMAPPRGAAADDLLDACAAAWTAARIARGEAASYPEPPARDAHGLPMAIRA